MGRKKRATEFELRIKQLFQNLQFNDVDGANDTFRISELQVDVCAGWDNALLIVECKSQDGIGPKSLRSAIGEFRGKMKLLKEGFRAHPIYKKYNFFKFLLATRNIDVRPEDIEYANQDRDQRVYICTEDFLEYYEYLFEFIKPYAKFDLLGELGVKPSDQRPITIPAFRTKIGDSFAYHFVMNPKQLLEVSFVARRESRNERYYQRIIDKDRLNKIAQYIQNGGHFANNIILAFKEHLKVSFRISEGPHFKLDWPYPGIAYGILEFPRDYRSCWIIDGQHRLYSFVSVEGHQDFTMPITAFQNIPIEQQRKFFLDINKNQRPVDGDLLWDLSSDVSNEREGTISRVVKQLNISKSSPLSHQIYYPSTGIKSKKGRLKISALCNAIKRHHFVDPSTSLNVQNSIFNNDPEKMVVQVARLLEEYFKVLKKVFPTNWNLGCKGFILTNGGATIMLGLLDAIITRAMQLDASWPSFGFIEKYVSPLADEEYLNSDSPKRLKELRDQTTSSAAKIALRSRLVAKIRAVTKDNLFGGELSEDITSKRYVDLEKQFKELIKNVLSNPADTDWFQHVSDPSIYNQAKNNMAKRSITDSSRIYTFVGFGDCRQIIQKHWDKFSPYFIGEGPQKYQNKTIFDGDFSRLALKRIDKHHSVDDDVAEEEEEIELAILRKMERCLAKAIETSKVTESREEVKA